MKGTPLLLLVTVLLASGMTFTGCSRKQHTVKSSKYTSKARHKSTMRSYRVHGRSYSPTYVRVGQVMKGISSWYGPNFHGKLTSNGERYNMYDYTAAHKTLPMNTILRVTNKNNGRVVRVRINDRGPFVGSRIIDLSKAAAKAIGMIGTGTAPVRLEVIGFATKNKMPTNQQLKRSKKQYVESGNFALQIGSFSKIQGAIKTQEKFDGIDGYKTIIKDVQTPNGRMYKVWLRGFKSEKEARDYKAISRFKTAFIIKED
jgi:rare lipoprotein A